MLISLIDNIWLKDLHSFAALGTSLNQLLSPIFTLPIYRAWSSPPISTLHLIQNKLSTHEQAAH